MFSVTFETTTYESVKTGDFESSGYVSESCSLREAMDLCGFPSAACEADCYPVNAPRWFTNYEYGENYRTGERESRSLHIPDNATRASRNRIARLLGLKVSQR